MKRKWRSPPSPYKEWCYWSSWLQTDIDLHLFISIEYEQKHSQDVKRCEAAMPFVSELAEFSRKWLKDKNEPKSVLIKEKRRKSEWNARNFDDDWTARGEKMGFTTLRIEMLALKRPVYVLVCWCRVFCNGFCRKENAMLRPCYMTLITGFDTSVWTMALLSSTLLISAESACTCHASMISANDSICSPRSET